MNKLCLAIMLGLVLVMQNMAFGMGSGMPSSSPGSSPSGSGNGLSTKIPVPTGVKEALKYSFQSPAARATSSNQQYSSQPVYRNYNNNAVDPTWQYTVKYTR